MSKLLLLLLLAVIILMTQSFSLHSVRSKSLLSKSKVQFSSRSEETTTTEQPLLAIITAASASLMTIPQLALADDGKSNAFFFPLVISLMTLLPFLYYQQ